MSWQHLPAELLYRILQLLVPKVVGWRWELHLPEGGAPRIQGDNKALSAANLVCKSWSSQASRVVTRLNPSSPCRNSPVSWQSRFSSITSLDCTSPSSPLGFMDLWPLTNLVELSIWHSRTTQRDLADLHQLSGLTKLEIMDDDADGRRRGLLRALEPLSSNLRSLSVDGLMLQESSYPDLVPFTALESLYLSHVENSDSLRALQAVPTLTRLALPYGLASTRGLEYLTTLTRLTHLDLAANENVVCEDVAMLTTLKILTLEACGLEDFDIEDLSPLTGLTALSLSMNHYIADLSNIQVFSSLTCLNIRDLGEIRDLNDLQPLTSLTSLTMSCVPFAQDGDLTSLRHLTNLEDLSIHDAAHSTMSILKHLPRLKELMILLWSFSLGDEDLQELHSLTSLRRLFIQQHVHEEEDIHVGPAWTPEGLDALRNALPLIEEDPPAQTCEFFSRIIMCEKQ